MEINKKISQKTATHEGADSSLNTLYVINTALTTYNKLAPITKGLLYSKMSWCFVKWMILENALNNTS